MFLHVNHGAPGRTGAEIAGETYVDAPCGGSKQSSVARRDRDIKSSS